MITDNQTNKIYFSPALERDCPRLWTSIHQALTERKIRHGILMKNPQYFWCRDYMPIQIAEDNFVVYHFRPNYLLKEKDKYDYALKCDGYEICKAMNYPMTEMNLVLDGGNVVKCGDTIVMTDKVFRENSDKSRIEVERILHDKLQSDILFLPWDTEDYCGHSDGMVHYAGEGRILASSYYYDFYPSFAKEIEKILEKKFDVIRLKSNIKLKNRNNWAYINFLQTEKLIMVPQLDIEEEDALAVEQISNVFPDVEVIGIPALEAVNDDGALNCVSWNIKDNGTLPHELAEIICPIKQLIREFPELMNGNIMKPIIQFAEDTTLYPSPDEIGKAKHAADSILRHAESVLSPSFIPESSRRLALSDGSVIEITNDNANKWIDVAGILRVFLDRLQHLETNLRFEFVGSV